MTEIGLAPADYFTGYNDDSADHEQGMSMSQIDPTSRLLGELSAGLSANAEAMRTGFVMMNSRLDAMAKSMKELPPSPECQKAHAEFRADITRMKIASARHIGYASGVAAVGTIVLQWLVQKAGIHLPL